MKESGEKTILKETLTNFETRLTYLEEMLSNAKVVPHYKEAIELLKNKKTR